MTVTLETAKLYLRVDSSDEDTLIEGMMASAQKICKDVLRAEELPDSPEVDIAVFYALAYLYEHREEADHEALMETLRAILGAERKEVF